MSDEVAGSACACARGGVRRNTCGVFGSGRFRACSMPLRCDLAMRHPPEALARRERADHLDQLEFDLVVLEDAPASLGEEIARGVELSIATRRRPGASNSTVRLPHCGHNWQPLGESGERRCRSRRLLNSVALSLHSFYSGLERIFELIALEIDGGTLGGDAWHAELLWQMLLDMPDMRPAVLQPETASTLDRIAVFGIVFATSMRTRLDPERIKPLVIGLPVVWQQLHGTTQRLQRLPFQCRAHDPG